MNYLKIHPLSIAIALGAIEGLPVFVATILLVLQGESGEAWLSKLFPGYSISWSGAFIGLVEWFIDGAIGGFIFAWVYNSVIRRSLTIRMSE